MHSYWLKLVLWVVVNLFFQSKEEVMAVRLREADRIAAVAELQQHIAELEIQVTHARMKRVASCSFFLYLFSCPSLSFFF